MVVAQDGEAHEQITLQCQNIRIYMELSRLFSQDTKMIISSQLTLSVEFATVLNSFYRISAGF